MSLAVFLMVLGAALMHAIWNAAIKSDNDRLGLVKVMFLTQFAVSVCLLPFVAVPARESWPYLGASAALGMVYMLFLNWAYQVGDLSHVYPFARGIAPLIVAIVSVFLLGEQISHLGQVAIVLIALGIASLALTRGGAGLREPRLVLLSLIAGGFVGAFTITDALGSRSAGSPNGFIVWMTLLYALLVAGSCYRLQHRKDTRAAEEKWSPIGVVAGLMSYACSWLVIWALTLAPMALVSALRETSVAFAVVIGVVFLRERLNLARLVSIATTLIGTTVLKLSR
ncbi:MAG TPA: EamA family transporter [Stellaceae bacterium]|nr:EamA family transporter [Stellaceae bacterium]